MIFKDFTTEATDLKVAELPDKSELFEPSMNDMLDESKKIICQMLSKEAGCEVIDYRDIAQTLSSTTQHVIIYKKICEYCKKLKTGHKEFTLSNEAIALTEERLNLLAAQINYAAQDINRETFKCPKCKWIV